MKGSIIKSVRAGLNRKLFHFTWAALFLPLACPFFLNAAVLSLKMENVQYVGGEFRVDIMVSGVNDLYGMAFDLTYDPAFLEVVDADKNMPGIQPKVQEGTFLNNNAGDTTLLGAAVEDDTQGVLVLGLTRSGSVTGVSSTPETRLISVFFRAKTQGENKLLSFHHQGLKGELDQDLPFTLGDQITLTIQEYDWAADVNRSKNINLTDTILVLKALSNKGDENIFVDADVNGNKRIGFEEAITVLQKSSKPANP